MMNPLNEQKIFS